MKQKDFWLPIFQNDFDFIIWFLKNNVPVTPEQKEVKKFLEKLVRNNLHILKVQNVKWLVISDEIFIHS